MSYLFTYSNAEKSRIVPSVLIDSRATISAIKNKIGAVIKAYTDGQVALILPGDLFYKIESEIGNLAGYFVLRGGLLDTVVVTQFQLRPAFQGQNAAIQLEISNFVTNGSWKADSLV